MGGKPCVLITIMKKTLLTSALAVMALAASAQSQVASPAGEFEFITKNLTVGGKIIPASLVKDEENAKYDITIYDSSFNTERTFQLPLNDVKVKYVTYTASLPIKEVKFDKNSGYNEDVFTPEKPLESLEQFEQYVKETYGSPSMIPFTDSKGNWYCADDYYFYDFDRWNGLSYTYKYWGYYDKAENKFHMCYTVNVTYVVDDSNIAWKAKEEAGEETLTPTLKSICLKDYDANDCAEGTDNYITQSLFNKDEKFEFVTQSYREATGDNGSWDINGDGLESSYKVTGISNGCIDIATTKQSKAYESYISVINEDGKEIVALPEGSYDLYFIKLDGKLYMTVNTYKDGQEQTIIYSVDNVNTSITELARTNAVKSRKTFNLSGMQVSKDAKGIVIQQGGKKYINK